MSNPVAIGLSGGSSFLAAQQQAPSTQNLTGLATVSGSTSVANLSDTNFSTIYAQGADGTRSYDFPPSAMQMYPRLSDPQTRFVRLDDVYPLLVSGDINNVSVSTLEDSDGRQRFFYACQKVGYVLSTEEESYLLEVVGTGLAVRQIAQFFASLGRGLEPFLNSDQVKSFHEQANDHMREIWAPASAQGVSSEVIISYIRRGQNSWLARTDRQYCGIVSYVAVAFRDTFVNAAKPGGSAPGGFVVPPISYTSIPGNGGAHATSA